MLREVKFWVQTERFFGYFVQYIFQNNNYHTQLAPLEGAYLFV